MARKGKEIQLQQEIETQEEWEDMLSKEGLCVIDVHASWCGVCSGMTSNFKKIRNDLNDDLLRFWGAKADNIDALEKYRGRCEPCFLFYAGGVLVAVIRGANAPLILRTITEQLAQEHKVLEGQAERKEIKDTRIAELEASDKQAEEEEEVEGTTASEPVKEVSVVIIKPDAVQSGKADEILAEMKKRGIEVLRQEERQLTDDEVKNVYTHLQDEPFFEELVAFMTSSPSIVLAITKGKTGQNVIKEFRDLIGPTEVEDAKEQAPDSLRAKYGQGKYMNAVHGSDSSDTAAQELAFFFPDFVAPKVEGAPKLQRTLALIRPDAYKKSKDEIVAKIKESGFKIAMSKEIQLTKEQAEDFYSEHQGQDYFDELTTRMSSGPLLALGLAREEAISGWRDLLGPTKVEEAKEQKPESLRAQFSEDGSQINMLHGSDSEATAKKELEYFFPVEQTVAVIKPDAIGTKDEIIEKIHEAGFRIAARKETTLSKEIAEEFYADHKDKEYYNELVEHMSSGPTYFMVLSREGAVDGWRSLIGPTDPATAKEADPDTDIPLRGKYGTDKLRNAVHGSSDPEHAKSQIAKIFEEDEANLLIEQWPESPSIKFITPKPSKEKGSEQKEEQKREAEEEPKPVEEPAPTQQTEEQAPAQQEESGTQQTEQTEQSEQQQEDKPKSPEPVPEDKPAETTEEKSEEPKPADEPKPDESQSEQKEEPKVEEQAPTEEPKADDQQKEEAPKVEETKPTEEQKEAEGEQKPEDKKDEPAKPADGAN